ncbi:MAG: tetratricopeptide repeat protein [Bacteroidota bacterium]
MVRSTHRGNAGVMKSVALTLVLLATTAAVGCSGSEEMLQQQAQTIAEQEKQMEEMRTENTSLRQRMLRVEQENKNVAARLSEAEAKMMMERDRADKAEAALEAAMTKPKPKNPAEAMTAYEEALGAFHARNYDDAIARFEALAGANVGGDLEDNCHYWIGESYNGKRQYADAIRHFEMVMNYTGSEKMADAHFMIAQCYERMGNKANAKSHYERVVKDFPASSKGAMAKQRWEKL